MSKKIVKKVAKNVKKNTKTARKAAPRKPVKKVAKKTVVAKKAVPRKVSGVSAPDAIGMSFVRITGIVARPAVVPPAPASATPPNAAVVLYTDGVYQLICKACRLTIAKGDGRYNKVAQYVKENGGKVTEEFIMSIASVRDDLEAWSGGSMVLRGGSVVVSPVDARSAQSS